jgi:methanogenic corrinoid protein MtbC1
MPEGIGRGKLVPARLAEQMAEALEHGEFERLRSIGFELYLAGHLARDIFDHALAPAFHALGRRWQHGEIEIYQERRGCEMCMQFLRELLRAIPSPSAEAPYAIGGTLAGDGYTLGAHMAEIVLREAGWRAECYGVGLPAATWCVAMEKAKPRLVWLSVSWMESVSAFVAEARKLCRCAKQHGVALVVGGRALSESIRQQLPYSAYGDNFQHLAAFAETLWQPAEGHAAGGLRKKEGGRA